PEPRGSNPRGSTPRGSTPRGSTPRGSTPRGSTPRGSTPRGSTPPNPVRRRSPTTTYLRRQLFPGWGTVYDAGMANDGLRDLEPRGSNPRGSTPRGSTPRGSTPRGSTPRGSTPRGSTPRGSTPPNPVRRRSPTTTYLRRQLFPGWGTVYDAGMANDGLRDLEQQAWAGFLLTHDRLWRELEAGLAPMNMSMAEYNVLTLLEAAGQDGMRMSDLARERLMSTGGVTRLADRLQQRELIRRRQSAVDARSFDMVLTQDGQAALDRARVRHHQDLRRLVF